MSDEHRAWRLRYRLAHDLPTARIRLPKAQHGTRSGYVAGCRCDPCSDADSTYQQGQWLKRKERANGR